MSYLHLAPNANSSSSSSSTSTPSCFFNVNSNGSVTAAPTTLSSNTSSLLGTIGGGKQWTTIGQSSSSTSLSQQLLMKQQSFLSVQQPTSSHFDSILGSSSQTQIEKNFELQQEDFPPLPHRNTFHESASSPSVNISSLHQPMTNGFNSSQQSQSQHSQSQSPVSFKSSIDALSSLISRYQVSTNNKNSSVTNNSSSSSSSTVPTMMNITNLPSSTITDQYGLVGLLQMIQQAEKNPETAMLLNFDLTTLGLSMESPNDLYPTFISPFSDSQARAHEVDYPVPLEYQMGMQIREKLPQANFATLNEDTLFFLFYLFGNDYVQLSAANELYKRDWRYHKDERIWLTRIKNVMPDQKFDTYEIGVYCVFDVQLWRKIHKNMRIDYDKLDGPVVKQHPELLASKLLQQQYTPMTSYNSNSSR